MKKTNKKTTFNWIAVSISVTISITIILGIFGISFYLEKEQFTIYKTECRNETEFLGRKIVEVKNITSPYKMIVMDTKGIVNEWGVNIEFIKSKYPECDSVYCEYRPKCGDAYCSEIWVRIVKENYTETKKIYEEITKFKEVCEQKEVDTLILPKTGLIYLRTTNKSIMIAQLNKEWLDENAECISYCNKRHGQVQCPVDEETKIRGNYECSKWELNNYVIEVKNG